MLVLMVSVMILVLLICVDRCVGVRVGDGVVECTAATYTSKYVLVVMLVV